MGRFKPSESKLKDLAGSSILMTIKNALLTNGFVGKAFLFLNNRSQLATSVDSD